MQDTSINPRTDSSTTNAFGQPIGRSLPGWTPPPPPPRDPMDGRFCRLEALDADRHAEALFEANGAAADSRNWTYLFNEPSETPGSFRAWAEKAARTDDPLVFAIIDNSTEQAVGVATFMRIDPANGVIEVGGLNFSPRLQQTPAATEAMFLMMERAFALGYRRYEWKCDSLNAPSRRAAARLGFTYEGTFRQAIVYKGRNRDTAWFSVLDSEWPALQTAFQRWLAPENFDESGRQKRPLGEFR